MHPALHSWREELPATFVRSTRISGWDCRAFHRRRAVFSINAGDRFAQRRRSSIAEWVDSRAAVPGLRAGHSGGRRRAVKLRHPPQRRRRRPQGHPDAGRGRGRNAVPPGRNLSSRPRGRWLRQATRRTRRARRGARDRSPICTCKRRCRASSARCQIAAFDITRWARSRHCLGFVRAFDEPPLQIVRLVLPGRRGLYRTRDARLRARPADVALGRQRAEGRRVVCPGRAQPQLLRRSAIRSSASTPKYKLLWKALANRPEPRRIGR